MNNLYAHIDTLNERIRELEEGLQQIVGISSSLGINKYIGIVDQILEIATRLITNQPEDPPVSQCGPSGIGLNGTDAEPENMIAGSGHSLEISGKL